MLSRMSSQQSMSLLSKADTGRFDAQKLARDVVCFLQDSHTDDPDKCQVPPDSVRVSVVSPHSLCACAVAGVATGFAMEREETPESP